MLPLFPKRAPRLLAGETRCWCRCHSTSAHQEGPPEFGQTSAPDAGSPASVDRLDPVAAVTACTVCNRYHCGVFSGRPPELRSWNPRPLEASEPAADPTAKPTPPSRPDPQADGGGHGE